MKAAIISAPSFTGYDVVRVQLGQRSVVAPNLPKQKALTHMRNLKRRAIDGHTNVYFNVVPHT
jgi:hypothetical protein